MVDRGLLEMSTNFSNENSRILWHAEHDRTSLLPEHYVPGEYDVICSRGADSYNHVGNQGFRKCVESHLKEYSKATTKLEKSLIVSNIIDTIQSRGGIFVRQDVTTERWYVVGDKMAREKAGQAIRATLRKQHKTSKHYNAVDDEPDSYRKSFGCERVEQPARLRGNLREETVPLKITPTSSGDARPDASTSTLPLRRASTEPSPSGLLPIPTQFNHNRGAGPQNTEVATLAPPPLRRNSSEWTSFLNRMPGLFDYDPYAAPEGGIIRQFSDFTDLSSVHLRNEHFRKYNAASASNGSRGERLQGVPHQDATESEYIEDL